MGHGFGRAKLSAFAAVPELIENGLIVQHDVNWKNRGYESFVLTAPLSIGGEAYCAFVIVNSTREYGYRFYLHEVGKIAEAKRIAEGLRSGSSGATPALSRTLGDIRSIAYSIFACQPVDAVPVADVYDRRGELVGTKTILSYDDMDNIGKWVNSFRHDEGTHLGFMSNGRNDFQNTNLVYFINDRKQMTTPRGWWITPENLIPMCMFVAVRHSVEATWLNDRDTFLYPNDGWRNDLTFQTNCLVFSLFSDFNAIKSKFGVNHWIPFTEEEVGAKDCFKSHFMSDFLRASAPLCLCVKDISPVARAVLDAGRELWRYYHAQPDASPDASYYDIRLHFQGVKRTASGKEQMNPSSSDAEYTRLLAALRAAHKALAAQIAPKVYEYGFLKK